MSSTCAMSARQFKLPAGGFCEWLRATAPPAVATFWLDMGIKSVSDLADVFASRKELAEEFQEHWSSDERSSAVRTW